ncbi:MAG: hypothetical protein R2751_08875 [Bacteroidales bacterium]
MKRFLFPLSLAIALQIAIAPPQLSAQPGGSALSFDGTDDHVSVPGDAT